MSASVKQSLFNCLGVLLLFAGCVSGLSAEPPGDRAGMPPVTAEAAARFRAGALVLSVLGVGALVVAARAGKETR